MGKLLLRDSNLFSQFSPTVERNYFVIWEFRWSSRLSLICKYCQDAFIFYVYTKIEPKPQKLKFTKILLHNKMQILSEHKSSFLRYISFSSLLLLLRFSVFIFSYQSKIWIEIVSFLFSLLLYSYLQHYFTLVASTQYNTAQQRQHITTASTASYWHPSTQHSIDSNSRVDFSSCFRWRFRVLMVTGIYHLEKLLNTIRILMEVWNCEIQMEMVSLVTQFTDKFTQRCICYRILCVKLSFHHLNLARFF